MLNEDWDIKSYKESFVEAPRENKNTKEGGKFCKTRNFSFVFLMSRRSIQF